MEMALSRTFIIFNVDVFYKHYLALFYFSQVVAMLGSLVIIFFICWTPRSIIVFYALWMSPTFDKDLIAVALKALTLINNMINPMIYLITSQ